MNINKLIFIITLSTISFALISCSPIQSFMIDEREFKLNTCNDEEMADTRFQAIVDALEKEDEEGLKNMFSSNALKNAEDIDGGIAYIIDFFEGEIVSTDGGYTTSESIDHGEKTYELECSYKVITDRGNYSFYFIDQLVDTENPDNEGLYMLEIIKESDDEEFFYWGDGERCAGIYHPDTN